VPTLDSRLIAMLLLATALVPARVGAEPGACRAAITKLAAAYDVARLGALARCEEAVVRGKLPPSTTCAGEAKAVAALAKAASKLSAGIAKACGGPDGVCGGGDDESLAAIGWDTGTCPDFANAGCTNAISDCAGIVDCLTCVDTAAVATSLALSYDDLDLASPAGSELERCQTVLGKEAARYQAAKLRVLAQCWRAVGKGTAGAPCPAPGDGKAAAKIAKAEASAIRKICKACGGADRACDGTVGPIAGSGGTDDLTPAAIGFAAACPTLARPSGGVCASAIADLTDVVGCVACVADVASECVGTLAVPWAAGYPAVCNGPLPTPPPTSAPPSPTPSTTPAAPTATATPTSTPTATAPTPTPTGAVPTPSPSATATANPCAGFADTFGGGSLDPSWSVYNPGHVTISVGGGALALTPTMTGGGNIWFDDGEGPLVYKSITGDFTVTTVAHAEDPSNPGSPPPTQFRLGGLLVRDPGGTPGNRNSAHVALGAGDVANPIAVEDKTTVASSSNYLFYPIASADIELRITRSGSTIGLYYRAIGAGSWTLARSHAHPEMPATVQVGMMAYSLSAPVGIRVTFDEIACTSP
jgi:hypothetical protein